MTFYVLFCPQISHIIESFQVWNFVLEGSVVQFLDRLTRNILDFLKIMVQRNKYKIIIQKLKKYIFIGMRFYLSTIANIGCNGDNSWE